MFKLSDATLRRIQENDLDLILKWRNTDRIRKNMFQDGIIGWQQHVAWFETLQFRDDQVVLLFLLSNEPVGVVNFTNINHIENSCEWGFYIGREQVPKGSGLAMGILALEFAFLTLGVDSIIGQCFDSNRASSSYHEKLGFLYRKGLDKLFEREGTIFNVKQYELLSTEWRQKRIRLYRETFLD